MNPPHRILYCCYVWPEPESSAAGHRNRTLIQAFLNIPNVKLSILSGAMRNQAFENLERSLEGRADLEVFDVNDSQQEAWILKQDPTVVVFDRFISEEQRSWRIKKLCPQALRIVDSQDLHFVRGARQKQIPFSEEPGLLRELASVYRSDQFWVISDAELNILTEQFQIPASKIRYIPLYYSVNGENSSIRPHRERKDFLFIGNFRHAPNLDAIHFLAQEIWPQVRKRLPGAQVHIYGAHPPANIWKLQNEKAGFLICGPAKDSGKLFESYRVNLAPLRFGAGLKGKILEGFTKSLPCVSTPIGAEGIGGESEFAGEICSQPEEFIEACVELYANEVEWERQSKRALHLMQNRFSADTWEPRVREILQEGHSTVDWISEILWQQQFRSTEFFSRWIEEKNKK